VASFSAGSSSTNRKANAPRFVRFEIPDFIFQMDSAAGLPELNEKPINRETREPREK
jgi:hypothetical protein